MVEQTRSGDGDAPRKIAIVGGGPSRRRAPYRNRSWEIWAFSSSAWRYPRVSRWFEIHSLIDLRQQLSSRKRGRRTLRGYFRYMRRLRCPVYMMEEHPRIPNSVRFPAEELLERYGPCFTSTAAYMVALALEEGVDTIGLWGVDLRGRDYAYQRPALKYLLALARERGIRVLLARGCALRIPKRPRYVRTRVLYAYDWQSPGAWWRWRLRRKSRR